MCKQNYVIYILLISGFYTMRTCSKKVFVIFENKRIKKVKTPKIHDEKIVYSKKIQKNETCWIVT